MTGSLISRTFVIKQISCIERRMKNINGLKKIAMKAGSADSELFKKVLQQDPGLRQLLVEPGLTVYLMSDGTTVEVHSAGSSAPGYLFKNSNIVISYRVSDLQKAVENIQLAGAKLLGEIEEVCNSYKYCHLLTNDDTVIGLYEQH